jgi:hypothetical protein
MLIRPAVLAMAMVTTLIGAAYASSASPTAELGPECPDGYSFGNECTSSSAMTACINDAITSYPGCTVHCARCSTLNNFNCFMKPVQCQD